jgi:hypothetical protein
VQFTITQTIRRTGIFFQSVTYCLSTPGRPLPEHARLHQISTRGNTIISRQNYEVGGSKRVVRSEEPGAGAHVLVSRVDRSGTPDATGTEQSRPSSDVAASGGNAASSGWACDSNQSLVYDVGAGVQGVRRPSSSCGVSVVLQLSGTKYTRQTMVYMPTYLDVERSSSVPAVELLAQGLRLLHGQSLHTAGFSENETLSFSCRSWCGNQQCTITNAHQGSRPLPLCQKP